MNATCRQSPPEIRRERPRLSLGLARVPGGVCHRGCRRGYWWPLARGEWRAGSGGRFTAFTTCSKGFPTALPGNFAGTTGSSFASDSSVPCSTHEPTTRARPAVASTHQQLVSALLLLRSFVTRDRGLPDPPWLHPPVFALPTLTVNGFCHARMNRSLQL